MDDQNFINFKKKRDLGAMLSDTFQFLNTEWKPFFGAILKTAIIPILIAICAIMYYMISSVSLMSSLSEDTNYDVFNLNFSDLLVPILAFISSYIIAYALITITALGYIKSYIEHKGDVNYQEVQNEIQQKFWTYARLFFTVGVIVFFGALFCVLPGIYLGVVLSVSFCLVIFQNKGVFDAIGDSFSFIKNHWWETFGILIVVQLIVMAVGVVVDLPASLYQTADLASIFNGEDNIDVLSSFSDPIYLGFLAISYFVRFILYIVSIVISVFIYFDIKEQKNPSTDIIDEIGVN
ncbi:hypothetical protein K8354_05210 [Polaribacter litorisediminis]|uniref:hypothetical protein n=1 Tax=Polaribacter litorisediminis TaxID=1908341 RepID=UPI001CBBDACC|nr:hypothetical protein [Polaribacter litorisediminis]UAM99223.1 hypothetical protein K8354_05210 [Polaribacter litorisediminis]